MTHNTLYPPFSWYCSACPHARWDRSTGNCPVCGALLVTADHYHQIRTVPDGPEWSQLLATAGVTR